MLDLKQMNDRDPPKSGWSFQPPHATEFAKYLANKMWRCGSRYVVVQAGLTLTIQRIALVANLPVMGNVEKIELLPYLNWATQMIVGNG